MAGFPATPTGNPIVDAQQSSAYNPIVDAQPSSGNDSTHWIPEKGEFEKGLNLGNSSLAAGFRGAATQIAEPFAPDWAAKNFQDIQKMQADAARDNQLKVQNLSDVHNLSDFSDWGKGQIGQGAPIMGAAALTGLAGKGLGAALKWGPHVGEAVGGAATLFPTEMGSQANDLQNDPAAMANTTPWQRAGLSAGKGLFNTGLYEAAPGYFLGKEAKAIEGSRLAHAGGEALKGAALNAGMMGGAQVVGDTTQHIANPNHDMVDPDAIVNSMAGGAIAGAPMAGIGIARDMMAPRDPNAPKKTVADKLVDAAGSATQKAGELTQKAKAGIDNYFETQDYQKLKDGTDYRHLTTMPDEVKNGTPQDMAAYDSSRVVAADKVASEVFSHNPDMDSDVAKAALQYGADKKNGKDPGAAAKKFGDTLRTIDQANAQTKKYSAMAEAVPDVKSSRMDSPDLPDNLTDRIIPKADQDEFMGMWSNEFKKRFPTLSGDAANLKVATQHETARQDALDALFRFAKVGFTVRGPDEKGKVVPHLPEQFRDVLGQDAAPAVRSLANMMYSQHWISDRSMDNGIDLASHLEATTTFDKNYAQSLMDRLTPLATKRVKNNPMLLMNDLLNRSKTGELKLGELGKLFGPHAKDVQEELKSYHSQKLGNLAADVGSEPKGSAGESDETSGAETDHESNFGEFDGKTDVKYHGFGGKEIGGNVKGLFDTSMPEHMDAMHDAIDSIHHEGGEYNAGVSAEPMGILDARTEHHVNGLTEIARADVHKGAREVYEARAMAKRKEIEDQLLESHGKRVGYNPEKLGDKSISREDALEKINDRFKVVRSERNRNEDATHFTKADVDALEVNPRVPSLANGSIHLETRNAKGEANVTPYTTTAGRIQQRMSEIPQSEITEVRGSKVIKQKVMTALSSIISADPDRFTGRIGVTDEAGGPIRWLKKGEELPNDFTYARSVNPLTEADMHTTFTPEGKWSEHGYLNYSAADFHELSGHEQQQAIDSLSEDIERYKEEVEPIYQDNKEIARAERQVEKFQEIKFGNTKDFQGDPRTETHFYAAGAATPSVREDGVEGKKGRDFDTEGNPIQEKYSAREKQEAMDAERAKKAVAFDNIRNGLFGQNGILKSGLPRFNASLEGKTAGRLIDIGSKIEKLIADNARYAENTPSESKSASLLKQNELLEKALASVRKKVGSAPSALEPTDLHWMVARESVDQASKETAAANAGKFKDMRAAQITLDRNQARVRNAQEAFDNAKTIPEKNAARKALAAAKLDLTEARNAINEGVLGLNTFSDVKETPVPHKGGDPVKETSRNTQDALDALKEGSIMDQVHEDPTLVPQLRDGLSQALKDMDVRDQSAPIANEIRKRIMELNRFEKQNALDEKQKALEDKVNATMSKLEDAKYSKMEGAYPHLRDVSTHIENGDLDKAADSLDKAIHFASFKDADTKAQFQDVVEKLSQAKIELERAQERAKVHTFTPAHKAAAMEKINQMLGRAHSAMNVAMDHVPEATEEQKQAIREEHAKTLGNGIQLHLAQNGLTDHENIPISGEWRDKLIRISMFATDKLGTYRHEAVHQLFKFLKEGGGEKTKEILKNVGSNGLIRSQLEDLLKDHPEAVKQLDDPEEAAAYMYQFYQAKGEDGKPLLKLGPQGTGFFARVTNWFKSMFGLHSDAMKDQLKAMRIMDAFHDGEWGKDPDAATKAIEKLVSESKAFKGQGEKISDAIQDSKFLKHGIFSNWKVLKETGNKYLIGLSKKFYTPEGTKVEEGHESYFSAKDREMNQRLSTVNGIFKDMNEQDMSNLRDYMLDQTPPEKIHVERYRKAVEALRDYNESMLGYVRTSGAKTYNPDTHQWEQTRDRGRFYTPITWDGDKVAEKSQDFIDRLKEHHMDALEELAKKAEAERASGKTVEGQGNSIDPSKPITADDIAQSIVNNLTKRNGKEGGDLEESATEPGFTPYAKAMQARTLNFIDHSKFKDFIEPDLMKSVTGYTQEMVKRAEFARSFGNDGEHLRSDLDRAYALNLLGSEDKVKEAEGQLKTTTANLTEKYGYAPDRSEHHQRLMDTLLQKSTGELKADIEARDNRIAAQEQGLVKLRARVDAGDQTEALGRQMDNGDKLVDLMHSEQEQIKDELARREKEGDATRVQAGKNTLRGIAESMLKGTAEENAAKIKQATSDMKTPTDAIRALEGTLGNDISPGAQKAMQAITAYQNVRLLTFSLFSSFIDPLGIIIRGGEAKQAFKAFGRGLKAVKDTWMGNEEMRDTAYRTAVKCGAVAEHAASSALGESYGATSFSGGGLMHRVNTAFFKWNGLESFTRAMRIQAAEAGKEFIEHHLTKQGEHSERYLKELGLDPAKVKEYMKDGQLDLDNRNLQVAVNRWVDGAILKPNAAQRPIWASDPHYQLFYHLKQFTYSMHNTILRRAAIEMKHGNMGPAVALCATYVPMMIAADVLKNAMLPGNAPAWMQSVAGMLDHGYQRANLGGIAQLYQQNMPFIGDGHLSSEFGPFPSQIADMLSIPFSNAHSFQSEALRALPFSTAFGKLVKKGTGPINEPID